MYFVVDLRWGFSPQSCFREQAWHIILYRPEYLASVSNRKATVRRGPRAAADQCRPRREDTEGEADR